ncbi:hypothetical protein SAMN05444007_103233 [Cribrihabitans marinus]|uniref:DUF6456 domain-containing protein n=1 Tax=Cribrihabitans marinus TaxID=1227549 RepID=A0A1H6W0J5_9RHOB|nr:DUF6456 domain-containing protein [Cribrihabitans marinus]GGH25456.1 helix-turn-helix domain containing protein [Cribrihabitans marinus]SEJ05992.1 hypothetical protein SAMN05444007_103233 [Cribrihabitans marinus]
MDKVTAISAPGWVPEGVARYLAHTHAGRPIRDLARAAGCHASTVLRQIRRVEMRRDDPLVDAALDALAPQFAAPGPVEGGPADAPDATGFAQEALRVLRRLCESGAVLAVAEDMDRAVVVRDDGAGGSARTAVVEASVAQGLALQDWIACNVPGRISRYHITASGRAALGRLVAEAENRARVRKEDGFAEAQAGFAGPSAAASAAGTRRMRYGVAESPLIALARRRDRDGQPFLDEALVQAGERLREDFELAQLGPQVAQNWERFLTGGGRAGFGSDGHATAGPSDARTRVARALADLGPGLSDVALRCCCYLEGLELAEKRMGWSARSGKIVLRIALQRLRRHYEGAAGQDRMIG